MNGTRWPAALGLAMLVASAALATGCASSGPAPATSAPPRVRCLDASGRGSPSTGEPRPLFFLFCIQSP
jgi:hypothetical protein